MSIATEILKQIKKPQEVEVQKGVFVTYPALDRSRLMTLSESFFKADMSDKEGKLDMVKYKKFLDENAYVQITGWKGVTYDLLLKGSPHINMVAKLARKKEVEFNEENKEMLNLVASPFTAAIGVAFFGSLMKALTPESEDGKK